MSITAATWRRFCGITQPARWAGCLTLSAGLLIFGSVSAQSGDRVTVQLKSGEKVSGRLEDLEGGTLYLRVSLNDQRRIPIGDVVLIDLDNKSFAPVLNPLDVDPRRPDEFGQVVSEVIHFIERSRALQVEALTRAMQHRKDGVAGLPPAAITFMATSIALALTRESQLGISMGHREVERVISEALSNLEPVAPARTKSR